MSPLPLAPTGVGACADVCVHRGRLVGLVFFILGLGTLLPWNFLMTASLVRTRLPREGPLEPAAGHVTRRAEAYSSPHRVPA